MRNEAQLCPVCNGTGNKPEAFTSGENRPKPCHGCGGKGWVIVQQPSFGFTITTIGWPTAPEKH